MCNHCDKNHECAGHHCHHCHSEGEHCDMCHLNKFEDEYLSPAASDFATDVSEDKDNIYVSIHVPGIKMDKIDISVEGNKLRVTGVREEEHITSGRHYKQREIIHGGFERSIYLPCAVDESKATAELGTGVLHIQLPKEHAGKSGIKIKNNK